MIKTSIVIGLTSCFIVFFILSNTNKEKPKEINNKYSIIYSSDNKEMGIFSNKKDTNFENKIAPYFIEVLRDDLIKKFNEKDTTGSYIYAKKDGTPYNIYTDGLKIYTTIDSKIQEHAEEAVLKHFSTTLQTEFDKNNAKNNFPPFANEIKEQEVESIMNTAMKHCDRYLNMKNNGKTDEEIKKVFNTPIQMSVFSYLGIVDTVMTPMDSIKYYKGFLQAGLMSMDPNTGFIKAWVGGPNFNHFAYDHVKQSKRQVGSTIKPFIYAAAFSSGVVTPCQTFSDTTYCIDVAISQTEIMTWCPNTGTNNSGDKIPIKIALAGSLSNMTVSIMREMGSRTAPTVIEKFLKSFSIYLKPEEVVPAMCLGPMEISLFDMVGAYSTFANKGVYIEPIYIMRIEDENGKIIMDLDYKIKEAMSEDMAYTMIELLKGSVNGMLNPYNGKVYSTSGSLRSSQPWGGIKYPMAGKTGTTNSATDGWFFGLTPDLVTGVWVGADDKQIHFRSFPWGQGARMALPIYGYFMQNVYNDSLINISKEDFTVPQNYDRSIIDCD